jgi:transposase
MILFLHDDTLFFMEVIMRIPAPFPENSRELIGNSLKRAKTKSEFQRVQCIWLRITLGLAAEQIAEAIGWHVDTVRHVQSHYLRRGEIALKISGKGGRLRENMTVKEETQFLAPFFHTAESGGILVATDIKRAYEKRVGHHVPRSTIYRMLGRHGWRKIAPRPRHPEADPAIQEEFKKTS